ncbi:MAG: major capsid protein [Microviridae sp.]|nr:MAG: major capsid protein [Microviridae sp.]
MRNLGQASGFMNRMRSTPLPVKRTARPANQRILTSFNAGQMVPVMAIPLLREDQLARSRFRFAFEMQETVEVLMNAVNVRVTAYLVPRLAFERYDGLDSLNKSYEGVEGPTGSVVPWFETMVANAPQAGIMLALGKHAKAGDVINTDYIEAYNQIWNFRAKNRSADIPLRTRLDTTLAPAYWAHQTMAHIVPDFDQAVIDGEVALSVANSKMPIKGMGIISASAANAVSSPVLEAGSDQPVTYNANENWLLDGTAGQGVSRFLVRKDMQFPASSVPDIFAELQDNGITVSLSNIELARKTQGFAKLRQQYQGHSDEYIIDLLMDGIALPDQAWKQPILLADKTVQFGMAKRYASDGASLTESVTNGGTFIDLSLSTPRVNSGGIVMVCVEVTPEQLFERQQDPYLHTSTVDGLPQFLRDTLDPEKVEVVQCREIDVDHDTPTTTFGYAPLNHKWARSMPAIGGRFYRPEVDAAFDEDRQRIWAVETQNPVLSKDFYLCTTMHYKPFVITDAAIDHFDCLIRGEAVIRGNTVFGGLLVEATDNYDKIMEEAPTDRIDKDAAPAPAETATVKEA